jgi:enoyl-CoA hydratase
MQAKRYLLTGDALRAADAERFGLVTEVVPDGEADGAALAFAQRLAAGAPLAIQYTKQAVNQALKQALATSFDLATALEIVTFKSSDHAEALAALREKRSPRFEGR